MKIDRLLRKADLAFYNYENDGQIDTQALAMMPKLDDNHYYLCV